MAALVITSATYQAATLYLSWIGGGSGPTAAMTVTLANGAGAAQTFPASGFTATIAVDLGTDASWTAGVAPTAGGIASPTVPLIVVSPALALLQNSGGALNVAWQAAGGVSAYTVTLAQRNVSSNTHLVTGLSDSFPGSLSGEDWSCTVRASTTDGISQGPGSSRTPILDAPTLTMVDYSGTSLTLAWAPVAGFGAYSIWLQTGSAAPQSQATQALTASFAGALVAGPNTAWVCVQSADGICIGPPSLIYAPIQAAPVMTGVEFDGATLTLGWTPAAGYPVTLASLWTTGSRSTQQSVRGGTCSFGGPLTGAGDNFCVVRAASDDGVNIGPAAQVYTVIVGSPVLQEVDYDAGTLGLQWTPAPDPGTTGNLLVVSGGGQPASYTLGTSGSQSVAAALSATGAYGAVIQATNGIVTGPASAAVVPITAAPAAATLGFDGTHLRADWTAPAGGAVQGYVVELYAGGALTETDTATTLRQSFTSGLTADTLFTVRVRATGANAKGPWSAPAAGPYRTTLTYGFDAQDRIASIAWSNGANETYGFDGAGNLLSMARTAPAAPAGR